MKRLLGIATLTLTLTLTILPSAAHADNKNKDRSDHRDCEKSENCSDEDFSPKFYDSPVDIWICLPMSTCNRGEEEEAT